MAIGPLGTNIKPGLSRENATDGNGVTPMIKNDSSVFTKAASANPPNKISGMVAGIERATMSLQNSRYQLS